MVSGVLDIIDLADRLREAWEACIAHLFIWADREPEWEIRALVDNNGTAVPFGTPPPWRADPEYPRTEWSDEG